MVQICSVTLNYLFNDRGDVEWKCVWDFIHFYNAVLPSLMTAICAHSCGREGDAEWLLKFLIYCLCWLNEKCEPNFLHTSIKSIIRRSGVCVSHHKFLKVLKLVIHLAHWRLSFLHNHMHSCLHTYIPMHKPMYIQHTHSTDWYT